MKTAAVAAVLALCATAALAAPVGSRACPAQPLAPGRYDFTVESDGLNRTFIVFVPRSYVNVETPMMMLYHGYTNTANGFARTSDIAAASEELGFIGVVPQGYQDSWNGGDCCGSARSRNIDDVALRTGLQAIHGGSFTRRMVDFVAARVCVDPDRIFAGGYSNGGYMSYRLGCEASDLIRAIGPVAGSLSSESTFSCTRQTKMVPLIHFHGTNDLTIPYRLGENSVERYTTEIAECPSTPVETFQNGTATCMTWFGCNENAQVSFCTIEGQGHAWPEFRRTCTRVKFFWFQRGRGLRDAGSMRWPGCADPGCSGTKDINATREMYKFFLRNSADPKRK